MPPRTARYALLAIAPLVLAAAPASAAGAGAAAMTTAHRTSGVAPLAVFFDAVDVTPAERGTQEFWESPFRWRSGVVQPSDREGALYVWDFGDPRSGTWSTTGGSRNAATGYTAAHVYESPGSYTATLSVTDARGVTTTYTERIEVAPFRGTTYYVSSQGSDGNDGLSEQRPLATLHRAMTTRIAPNVRILLRRGDTFTAPTHYRLVTPGPVMLGAYGSGPRPVVRCESTEAQTFQVYQGPGGTRGGTDWRFVDLDLVGPGGQHAEAGAIGPPPQRTTRDLLLLRVRTRDWRQGFAWADWDLWAYENPNDGMFLVETENAGSEVMAAYVGGHRLALLGNDWRDPKRSHVLRVWQAHKAVISNNRLWNPGGNRHALKLHGPSYGGENAGPDHPIPRSRTHSPATRWVTVNDNVLRPFFDAGQPDRAIWLASIGPQDGGSDERVSHVVYERNLHEGGVAQLDTSLEGSASDVLVRNNVFVGTNGGGEYHGVWWIRRGVEPSPTNVRIYGNTVYKRSRSANASTGFRIGAEVARCTVRNNLVVDAGGGPVTVFEGGGEGFVQDHNVLVKGAAARVFRDAEKGDFALAPGSPAVDAGAVLAETREDFLRVVRAGHGASHDAGAYER